VSGRLESDGAPWLDGSVSARWERRPANAPLMLAAPSGLWYAANMASTRSRSSKPRSKKPTTKRRRTDPDASRHAGIVAAAPTDAKQQVYLLDDLYARTGPSTLDEVSAFVHGMTDEALVQLGARVATSRIETDVARLLGVALDAWQPAHGTRSAAIRGVSTALLRACVWSCVQAREAYVEMHDDLRRIKTARRGTSKGATSVRGRARAAHAHLLQVLESLVAGHPDLEAQVEAAGRVGDRADGYAGSIDALVAVGRRILAKPTAAIEARLADGEAGVSEDWLDGCAELAAELRKLGVESEGALARPAVSQTDVDLWDGRAITLLRRIIGLYEAAHAVDPTVPRLVPIALRSLLIGRSKALEESAQPGAEAGGD